jgi:phosphatidylglycerophosphatase A
MSEAVRKTEQAGFRLAQIVASFFYVGYVPIIPGTFGSLAAFLPYFFLLHAAWPVYIATIVLVTAAGIWAAGTMERTTKIIDPSFVVIDEVAGQLITLFLIPFSWPAILAGFILFRVLDIIKPFPAGNAEKLPGGWGIMLDDVLVGVYGNILLQIIFVVLPRFL